MKVPEEFPAFKGKYRAQLDYTGPVAKGCIHCHQVGESVRLAWRGAGKAIPETLLFPYPNPRVLGFVMDPKGKARVLSVSPASSAEQSGFRAGDEITSFAGQPVLSIADLQWVLHHAGDTGTIASEVLRDGKTVALELKLAAGWRARDNIAWRTTSWDLRRMVTGGLCLDDMPNDARKAAGIGEQVLAMQVTYVGQYGEHAVGKNAGFQEGDVILAIDGITKRMTESEWLTSMAARTKPGDILTAKVRRGAADLELKLPVQ